MRRKKGDVWLHHFYVTRDTDGKRVETTRTVGMVSKFPRKSDAWAEVMRRSQIGISGRLTVAALVESYKKTELPQREPSVQETNGQILRDYVLSRWGKSYVDEVRVLELTNWFRAIANEKGLAAATIQKIKQVFGRLYAFGSENELIAVNLNPVWACNIRGIGTDRKSKVILVSPEIALKIAFELPIMRRTLVLLDAVTGIRASELLGLQWRDIDLEAGIIQMNRTWRQRYIGKGKTLESRKPVVIGKLMIEFLREWHRETPYAAATDWVFPSLKLKGKKPISGSQFVKDYLRPRFIKCGLIDADYRGRAGLHAFRHSLASTLITQEHVDPKTVQAMLRHVHPGLTLGLYTHSQDEAKRKAVERYESRWVAESQVNSHVGTEAEN